jgi:ketosteroid isomerase-like protein
MSLNTPVNLEIAKRYFAAVNETRLDELASLFAVDGVLKFPMLEPISGRKAIRDFYAGVLQFYPERFDQVTRWFMSSAGDVAAEIHFEGRTTTGRSVVFNAVDLFTIHDEMIGELCIFYDSARVLQMVGELPK